MPRPTLLAALLAALLPPVLPAAHAAQQTVPPPETPPGAVMTPQAFRAWAEGTTLHFAEQGVPYGVEQYLPGNRAIWQFADGSCATGRWYGKGQAICFVYEGDPKEQCWLFLTDGPRPRALSLGGDRGIELEVTYQDNAKLNCTPPDVGS